MYGVVLDGVVLYGVVLYGVVLYADVWVQILKGSKLSRVLGSQQIHVNLSLHHLVYMHERFQYKHMQRVPRLVEAGVLHCTCQSAYMSSLDTKLI